MESLQVAVTLCTLVDEESLLHWLDLPPTTTSEQACAALHARRRKLQSLQSSPKHRPVARLVIKHYRALEGLLSDPASYLEAVRRQRVRDQLPLLDIGVDGVLADGTVTEEELAFLHATARRLGLDPHVALGRLRLRAEVQGVSLAPPPPRPASVVDGPPHPLLPTGWLDDDVTRWLGRQLTPATRRVVQPACGAGQLALALASEAPGLAWVGFDPDPATVAKAERHLDAWGLSRATALPADAEALPLSDDSVDMVWFVLHVPSPAELAEARRVLTERGEVCVVTPGVPRVCAEGPVRGLDAALWSLCRAAGLAPADRADLAAHAASTFVITRTVAGHRDQLVALLLRRVAALRRHSDLADHHPAVRSVGLALEALSQGPAGVGSYEVPLVSRRLPAVSASGPPSASGHRPR